nr:hypothetical protein [Theobroma cacao]
MRRRNTDCANQLPTKENLISRMYVSSRKRTANTNLNASVLSVVWKATLLPNAPGRKAILLESQCLITWNFLLNGMFSQSILTNQTPTQSSAWWKKNLAILRIFYIFRNCPMSKILSLISPLKPPSL